MGRSVITAVLVFSSLSVAAWAADESPGGKSAKSSKVVTLTGCLDKGDEANEFVLKEATDDAGEKAGEVELLGTKGKKLGAHVGHKVEVKGSMVSGREAAKTEGESAKEEKGHAHLRMTAMKHIAATCP
jgi:hypothetical protein